MQPITVPRPAATEGRRQPAHRFIYSFVSGVVAGCLLLGGFNYVVNPLNYYPPRIVKPLAWGDQLEKVDLMKTAPKAELLILGSSRTMKLAPTDIAAITQRTAFNGGVSSSRPEEWYAMLRYSLEDLQWPVREIVLGIDMETLFYDGEPNEDLLSSPALRGKLPTRLWLNSLGERAKLLLSFDQLQLSYTALQNAAQPAAAPAITFDANGYLHYVGWEKAVAAGNFTLVTTHQIPNYTMRYAGASGINPLRQQLLEEMLKLAQARGIRVRAFFTPFHPSVLAEMEKLPTYQHVHTEMTRYARDVTARFPNVTIGDYTDVSAFGGDPNNFFDGVHYRQENARRIVTALYRM